MKKSLLAISLAVFLLLGIAFLSPLKAKAAINAHADGASAHCVCCDTAIGVGSHTCDATVTWTAVSSHSEIASAVAANCNIYLTQDIQLTGRITISKTVNLCLNGHTLTAKADKGAFIVTTANGNLSITDCSAGSTGKLVGGSNNGNGGTIAGNSGTTINIFAGTITGGTASYTSSAQYGGGNIYSAATLNIYGGTISNGTATDNVLGGNIYSKGGTLNIYGGSVTGGTSTGSDKGGGNIYATGALNISGGTISNGTAQAYYGGNLCIVGGTNISIANATIIGGSATRGGNLYINYTANDTSLISLSNCTIANGTATARGGNLFLNDGCFALVNCTVIGGKSPEGAGICVYGKVPTLTLCGTTIFSGNTLPSGVPSISGEQGADIFFLRFTDSDGTLCDTLLDVSALIASSSIKIACNNETIFSAATANTVFVPSHLGASITAEETGLWYHFPDPAGILLTVNGEACYDLASAFANLPDGAEVVLLSDLTENLTLNVNASIDFNGHGTAPGKVLTVAAGKTLLGSDSATDDYSEANAASVSISGTVAAESTLQAPIRRYLTIRNANDSYQFHRFYVSVTNSGIYPANQAIGVQATFAGTPTVLERMPLGSFGFVTNQVAYNLDPTHSSWTPVLGVDLSVPVAAVEGTGSVRTASYIINNIFDPSAPYTYNFRAYIQFDLDLNAETEAYAVQSFGVVHVNPKTVLNAFNDNFANPDYSAEQRQAVYNMVTGITGLQEAYGGLYNIIGYNSNPVYKNFVDLPLANSSMTESELRDLVVSAMEYQLTLPWKLPDSVQSLTYSKKWRPNASDNPSFTLYNGFTYGGLRYVSETGGSMYNLLHYYNPVTKVLDLQAVADYLGVDLTTEWETVMSVVANQCSSATYWSWSRITPNLTFEVTGDMLPTNGCITLISEADLTTQEQKDAYATLISANSLRDLSLSVPYQPWRTTFTTIGRDAMYAAYARLQKGDGLTDDGHSIMVVSVDATAQTVTIYDQASDGTTPSSDSSTAPVYYQSASAPSTKTLTFAQLYSTYYLPFTLEAFTASEIEAATVSSNLTDGASISVDSLFAKADGISIDSNYPISYITMHVLDAKGDIVNSYPIYNAHLAGTNNSLAFSFNAGTALDTTTALADKPGYAAAEEAIRQLPGGTQIQITATLGTSETFIVATVSLTD